MKQLRENPMTSMLTVIFAIVVIVGGVVVIVQPATLDFQSYVDTLEKFAIAVGVFGAGKAVKNGLREQGTGPTPPAA